MSEMTSRTMRGAQWTMAARLSRALIGVGTVSILSRYLSPAEFGIIALLLFMTAFASFLADFGLRTALIQRRVEDETSRSSVFWANLLLGIVLTGSVFAFAPQIAALFDAPRLAGPLRFVCVVYLLSALQGVPMSVLEQQFDFRSIAVAEITASVIGSVTVIALVLTGLTLEAVIVQQLVYSTVGAGLIILFSRWRPRRGFSWNAFQPLISYSAYVAMGSLTNFFSQQTDRPILSRMISAQALGYYSIASQIVSTPLLILGQAAMRVLFPALSTLQDDPLRLRRAYLKTMNAMTLVMAPTSLGLVAVAEPFVDVLLGPGWEPVAILIVLIALRTVQNPVAMVGASMFAAVGRARLMFYWGLLSSVVTIGSLIIFARYGLVEAIAARLVVSTILVWANCAILLRVIDQGWRGLLAAIGPPILSAAVMCAAVSGLVAGVDWPSWVKLAVGVPTGAVIYGALIMLTDRTRALALAGMLLRRKSAG